MKKPSVYLDTSIISAYWYEGSDVASLARRVKTREWWEQESEHFSVWVAAVTLDELSAGRFPRPSDCLTMARRLRRLPTTALVRQIVADLFGKGVIPRTKPGDAFQMAASAAHETDYLLTWNYAHLANPIAQERLAAICRARGLCVPLLVSPESIPQVRFGQTIRRRKRP
jgi:hypothetical protein